jgi:hypothetical protein
MTTPTWTYGSITEALHHRTILLRVHPSSPTRQEGFGHGFTARNSAFKGLTPDQYALAVSGLRGEKGWAEGPYMRDMIVDHINGVTRRIPIPPSSIAVSNNRVMGVRERVRRPYSYLSSVASFQRAPGNPRPGGPGPRTGQGGRGRDNFPFHPQSTAPAPDDLTPWISTTANLDWALWYIAKLLTSHTSSSSNKVYLSIISISTDRRDNKELYVAPFLYHNLNNADTYREMRDKDDYDKDRYRRAGRNAVMAKEVLFYGRILKESVLATMGFTTEVSHSFFRTPLLLPSRGLSLKTCTERIESPVRITLDLL